MKCLLLGFSIFLIGCSSLFVSKDNVQYFYVLNPVDEVIDVKYPARVNLFVPAPDIPEWLDVQHIILRRGENQIDFYAEARWAADAGKMIHELVVQSLVANHVATNINTERRPVSPDYQLDIEVIALQAEYKNPEQPPKIRVALQGKLLDVSTGQVRYQFTVENITPAKHNHLGAVVKAFDTSMQACLNELVKRTAKALSVE